MNVVLFEQMVGAESPVTVICNLCYVARVCVSYCLNKWEPGCTMTRQTSFTPTLPQADAEPRTSRKAFLCCRTQIMWTAGLVLSVRIGK